MNEQQVKRTKYLMSSKDKRQGKSLSDIKIWDQTYQEKAFKCLLEYVWRLFIECLSPKWCNILHTWLYWVFKWTFMFFYFSKQYLHYSIVFITDLFHAEVWIFFLSLKHWIFRNYHSFWAAWISIFDSFVLFLMPHLESTKKWKVP